MPFTHSNVDCDKSAVKIDFHFVVRELFFSTGLTASV